MRVDNGTFPGAGFCIVLASQWVTVVEVGILPHYIENRYHGWNLFGRGSSTSSLQGANRRPRWPTLRAAVCDRRQGIGW